ncbi:MAG: hypothetical protein SGARI_002725, partial [Bacillariaceae sp.]
MTEDEQKHVGATDPEKMDVLTLREKLEQKDLDVDGTRDMLITRLKEVDAQPKAS